MLPCHRHSLGAESVVGLFGAAYGAACSFFIMEICAKVFDMAFAYSL